MPKAKSRSRITRGWNAISHHPLWAAVIAALIVAAVVSHSGSVFNSNSDASSHTITHPKTAPATTPLRVAFSSIAPYEYGVAFPYDIGLPKVGDQWQNLHNRGGVDVGVSDFHFTLANRSGVPLTVTSIEVIVRGSKPRPNGSYASVYSQGAASLERFGADLESETTGTTAAFHRIIQNASEPILDPASAPLFFPTHNITLAPNEIYEAAVTLLAHIRNEVEYGFVITGNTAHGPFSVQTRRFLISGYGRSGERTFGHEYWMLPEPSGRKCWVRVESTSFPHCP